MDAKIIRKGEAKTLMEGEELTQIYFQTEKIIFSISSLLPGQKASLDRGHKNSDEICRVIQGKLVMHLPDQDRYHLLNEGDAILIPQGEAHYSINAGRKNQLRYGPARLPFKTFPIRG